MVTHQPPAGSSSSVDSARCSNVLSTALVWQDTLTNEILITWSPLRCTRDDQRKNTLQIHQQLGPFELGEVNFAALGMAIAPDVDGLSTGVGGSYSLALPGLPAELQRGRISTKHKITLTPIDLAKLSIPDCATSFAFVYPLPQVRQLRKSPRIWSCSIVDATWLADSASV